MDPSIGESVRRAREKRGYTVSEAARRSDGKISKTGWRRIENGQRLDPRMSSMHAVCLALNARIQVTDRYGRIELEHDHHS